MKNSRLKEIEKELNKMDKRYINLYHELIEEHECPEVGMIFLRASALDDSDIKAGVAGNVNTLGMILSGVMDQDETINRIVKRAVTNTLLVRMSEKDKS